MITHPLALLDATVTPLTQGSVAFVSWMSVIGIVSFCGLIVFLMRWLVQKLTKVELFSGAKAWFSRIGDQFDREKLRHRRIEKFLGGWQKVAAEIQAFSSEYRDPTSIFNSFEDITNRESREYKKRLIATIEDFRKSGALILEVTQYAVGIQTSESQKIDNFFRNINGDAKTTADTGVKTEPQTRAADGSWTSSTGGNNTTATSPLREAWYRPDPKKKYTYFYWNKEKKSFATQPGTVTAQYIIDKQEKDGLVYGVDFTAIVTPD